MLISYGKRINLGRVHILYGGFGSEGPHYHLDNHTAYCVASVDCLLFSCKECLISGAFSQQGGSRGREQGCAHPPPEMTLGILIQLVFCKIWRYVWYVFSAVHIMLLLSQKPSSSYLLLKFVYVTSQLRCSSAHFIVILCKRIFSLYLTYQCGVHKHLIIMDIITLYQKRLFGRACVVSALLATMATVAQWWCYGIKIVLDTNIVHSPSWSSGMNNSTDINKLKCLVMSSSQNDRHLNNIHNGFNYSSSKTRTFLSLCCCFFHLWSFYSQPLEVLFV